MSDPHEPGQQTGLPRDRPEDQARPGDPERGAAQDTDDAQPSAPDTASGGAPEPPD